MTIISIDVSNKCYKEFVNLSHEFASLADKKIDISMIEPLSDQLK